MSESNCMKHAGGAHVEQELRNTKKENEASMQEKFQWNTLFEEKLKAIHQFDGALDNRQSSEQRVGNIRSFSCDEDWLVG